MNIETAREILYAIGPIERTGGLVYLNNVARVLFKDEVSKLGDIIEHIEGNKELPMKESYRWFGCKTSLQVKNHRVAVEVRVFRDEVGSELNQRREYLVENRLESAHVVILKDIPEIFSKELEQRLYAVAKNLVDEEFAEGKEKLVAKEIEKILKEGT